MGRILGDSSVADAVVAGAVRIAVAVERQGASAVAEESSGAVVQGLKGYFG